RHGGSLASPTCSSKPVTPLRRGSCRDFAHSQCLFSRATERKGARMPVQEFTFDDVRNILVNRIGLPADSVRDDPDVTFEELGVDSLALVEIQLAMQQEWDFTISDEDAADITTIGQAIDYVNKT